MISSKIFRLFYLSVILLAALALFFLFLEPQPVAEQADNSPENIIAQVDSDNYLLRARAQELSAGCTDKECTAYRLSSYIRDNEPLGAKEKTVLFASYLENLAIPTHLVYTNQTAPKVLACGLDRSQFYNYMLIDSFSTPFYKDTVRLAAGQTWTKIPIAMGSDGVPERQVAIQVEATEPIKLSIGLSAKPDSQDSCAANKQSIMQACNIKPDEPVSIFAADETQFVIALAYIELVEQDISVAVYKGQSCIAFSFL